MLVKLFAVPKTKAICTEVSSIIHIYSIVAKVCSCDKLWNAFPFTPPFPPPCTLGIRNIYRSLFWLRYSGLCFSTSPWQSSEINIHLSLFSRMVRLCPISLTAIVSTGSPSFATTVHDSSCWKLWWFHLPFGDYISFTYFDIGSLIVVTRS